MLAKERRPPRQKTARENKRPLPPEVASPEERKKKKNSSRFLRTVVKRYYVDKSYVSLSYLFDGHRHTDTILLDQDHGAACERTMTTGLWRLIGSGIVVDVVAAAAAVASTVKKTKHWPEF